MLCLIDNYDSFTYNLVHYLKELGMEVQVVLNDEIAVHEVLALQPTHVLLSPGPGRPDESGISKALLTDVAGIGIPLLGVCLGHEIICEVFGGQVVHANKVMHGKKSTIRHDGHGIFQDLPAKVSVARYHSLIVDRSSLPACLEVTAWTEDEKGEIDEIMAVRHESLPIFGVQFHPESVLTDHGHRMLSNFLAVHQ